MKNKERILWITQTALFLGLSFASQYYLTGLLSFNQYISQFAVGSLVNLFLILSTLICGFWSGFTISAAAPFIAFSLGRMPHVWMIPFVALGNIAITFVFWLICGKKIFSRKFTLNWAVASAMGAFLKFGVLWFGITKIFAELILPSDSALKPAQIEKIGTAVSFTFSFPQILHALIGCILSYAIYPVLKKVIPEKAENAQKP